MRNLFRFPALAAVVSLLFVTALARAATDFHQIGASGGGVQNVAMLINPVSGTMTAQIPRFNGALGTLIQADLEFAGSATGSWVSTPPVGTDSLSLTGPVDVDGQPMGPLSLAFAGTINDTTPSNDFSSASAFLSLTSGAYFNTLTGVGNITFSWPYSGSTTVSVPATGTFGFDWGGSAHVLYTYTPVPEPASMAGMLLAGLALLARRGRRV